METLVETLIKTDSYIASKNHSTDKHKIKWNFLNEWMNKRKW
jgi:hypothetical protein